MKPLAFWALSLLSLAVAVLGVVVARRDIHYAGLIACLGVVAVNAILDRRNGGAR
ncbi:hypothetical protein [Streptomyces sp. NPDC085479]|uniref:hypothetical protein n=1 Tax=Streptomyces sp. NPDC085479 TaxID=3365726 RepID=UPI0037D1E7A3